MRRNPIRYLSHHWGWRILCDGKTTILSLARVSYIMCTMKVNICHVKIVISVSSVQLLSHVWFFVTSWSAAHQASQSITNSRSLLKLISIELVMPSNHLILSRPLLLLPSICPSTRVFSNNSVLHIKWPKYWPLNTSSNLNLKTPLSFRILTKTCLSI